MVILCDVVAGDGLRTNWPCMSPQTVTGHRTGCTLDSSMRISLVWAGRRASTEKAVDERAGTDLLAELFDVGLCELFALAELLNPAVDFRRFIRGHCFSFEDTMWSWKRCGRIGKWL